MAIIWSDDYLDKMLREAEQRIGTDLDLHFTKYALTIEAGRSTYSLQAYTKKVLYITWKGKKLDPLQFGEINAVGPNTAVVNDAHKIEYSQGEPRFYSVHPTNTGVIRLLPTPNESLTLVGDEDFYDANDIRNHCVITCYRHTDPDSDEFSLPVHLGRRYTKHYALHRAFLKEGKGQNLLAASYHKSRYQAQLEMLKLINANTYISRRFELQGTSEVRAGIAAPQLPSRFPRR